MTSHEVLRGGNIPTCVGKTKQKVQGQTGFEKHPHLRGENPRQCSRERRTLETSPPAWGKQRPHGLQELGAGNIPTCVGKTSSTGRARSSRRKHPHLRGENGGKPNFDAPGIETSPPAWGKLDFLTSSCSIAGNIPTCVGKTDPEDEDEDEERKHPHLRGENNELAALALAEAETSPPAWGKPGNALRINLRRRNIPTCVGKTARCCLDCHSGYYLLLKSKFLALSLRQGCAIFAYYPSLGIDLRLAKAQRDVPNDCGGRVIKGRLLPN